jgi:hypothetical protein
MGRQWLLVSRRSPYYYHTNILLGKQKIATAAAVKACDALDGVTDGVLRDPRACNYSATALVCKPGKRVGCLTAGEAKAIDMIWDGSRDLNGSLLWYGMPRGSALGALAGSDGSGGSGGGGGSSSSSSRSSRCVLLTAASSVPLFPSNTV